MADVYASIADADFEMQERLAVVLERRAADIQQQSMLRSYLADLQLKDGDKLLDAGCGTGAVTREIALRIGSGQVVGIDPSPVFLAAARKLSAKHLNTSFIEGDCRSLPFDDNSFDAIFFHTTLSHIPGIEKAMSEAFRVMRTGGTLALFDGNYSTTTLATGDFDPLQACADAAMDALVHDRWLIQRLPTLIRDAGFTVTNQRNFSFVETNAPDYMLTMVDRGADTLVASGRISSELAVALKAEARHRVENGTFFGSIGYASITATK